MVNACIRIGSPELEFVDKQLKGPSKDCLACEGRFMGHLQKDKVSIEEKINVMKYSRHQYKVLVPFTYNGCRMA